MIDLINVLDEIALTETECFTGGPMIPNGLYNIISDAIFLIQIVVPMLLIIWGMIDFAKGVASNDDDKIKAGQRSFVKRLIAGIIVLFVVAGTKLVINVTASLDNSDAVDENLWDCAVKFIDGVGLD